MSQIHLPDALLQQIKAAGVTGSAVDAFVEQREAGLKKNGVESFAVLRSCIRQAMHDQGLTEEDILADFESFRREVSMQNGE